MLWLLQKFFHLYLGVFYRKPAPDSAPFLENGDTVQESTVIGLIEIMKQFNEIHAETTGTNIQFKVENGEEVELVRYWLP